MVAREGGSSSPPRADGAMRARRVAFVIGIACIAGIWILVLVNNRATADDGASATGEAPGYRDAERPLSTAPFELAGPDGAGGSTTLFFPETTTTQPALTTTTVLPGQDSDDQVCRAMGDLYDVSRDVGSPGTTQAGTIGAYRGRIAALGAAVSDTGSSVIAPQRSALVQLIDGVVAALTDRPTTVTLGEQYAAMTDTGNPAVLALLGHLRAVCPDVASTVEVGLR